MKRQCDLPSHAERQRMMGERMMQSTRTLVESCAKCGGTARRTSPQRFRDGSEHVRETCAGCGKFIRYRPRSEGRQTLPMAVLSAPPRSPSKMTLERAAATLEGVRERAETLLTECRTVASHAEAVAMVGCATAALANLSQEHLARLAEAVRVGQLPRGAK